MDIDEDSIPAGMLGNSTDHDPLSPSTLNCSQRGRSKVWNQFVVAEDGKKVICLQCGDSLAYSNSHSTSSMLKHLKRKHSIDLHPSPEDEHVKSTPSAKRTAKGKRVAPNPNPEAESEPESSIQHGSLFFKDQYCVRMKWTDHTDSFTDTFSRLYAEESYTDVTLVAERTFFKAHRVILSSASEFFDETFKMTPNGQHPIIFLNDVKALELRILLDFIYRGEISIPPSLIQDLVRIGTQMKIRGLCDFQFNDNVKSAVSNMNQPSQVSSSPSPAQSPLTSVAVPPLIAYTPLYSPVTSTLQTVSAASSMTSRFATPVVRTPTQPGRQILVTTSSPTTSRILNTSSSKTLPSDNLTHLSSHILTPVSSPVSTNSINKSVSAGVPALKRFKILAASSISSRIGVDTSSNQSTLKTESSLVHEGDEMLEQEIDIVSPSESTISIVKTEECEGDRPMDINPITLVSHHMDDTNEGLDQVVYSITNVTGSHGEVLSSDSCCVETDERETMVVYRTEENVHLPHSCESPKKTL